MQRRRLLARASAGPRADAIGRTVPPCVRWVRTKRCQGHAENDCGAEGHSDDGSTSRCA
jgi:hypothetical protein